MGHLSADYSGLYTNRGLGGSFPNTSGLGQALAGQQLLIKWVFLEFSCMRSSYEVLDAQLLLIYIQEKNNPKQPKKRDSLKLQEKVMLEK